MKRIKYILIIFFCFCILTNVKVFAAVDNILIEAKGYSDFYDGNLNQSMDDYQKALTISSNSPIAFDGLGDVFLKQHDYYKSQLSYKKASSLANNGNSIYKLHAQRAIYFSVVDTIKDAKKQQSNKIKICQSIFYIQTIVKNEPQNILAINLLSDFYILNNDYQSALNTLLLGLRTAGNNYELNKKTGEIYYYLNNSKEAYIYLQKAEKIKQIAENF